MAQSRLNLNQKRKILEGSVEGTVEKARKLDSRLRVFTESLEKPELKKEYGFKSLQTFWGNIFDQAKAERVQEFIRTPLASVELTENLLSELAKVLNPKDGFWKVKTSKENGVEVLSTIMDETKKHIESGWLKATKNRPSLALVVDFDGKQTSLISVESERVISASVKECGQFEHIAFVHSIRKNENGETVTKYAFYDAERYDVFEKANGEVKYLEEESIEHGLKYCPAHSYYYTPLNDEDHFNRKTPFTTALNKIEEFQIFDNYHFISEHYGSMPISERVVPKCSNPKCQQGKEKVLIESTKNDPEPRYKWEDCQVCATRKIVGPLTDLVHTVSNDPQAPDHTGKFRFVPMPLDALNHQKEMQQERKYNLRLQVVGYSDVTNRASVNELQVMGTWESRRMVNFMSKYNLEQLTLWAMETQTLLIGTSLDKVSFGISWGTEWYLENPEDVLKKLEESATKNVPQAVILDLYESYIESKYQGNMDEVDKMDILRMLEPMPFMNISEILPFAEKGLISQNDVVLKTRFSEFIDLLEEQVGDVTRFGSDLTWTERTRRLKDALDMLVQEEIDKSKEGEEGDGVEGATPEAEDVNKNAQAQLRGSVGGVQGIIQIQTSVQQGVTSPESAQALLELIYGFPPEDAERLIGKVKPIENGNN